MAVTINGTTGVSQVQDGIVTDDKLDLSANSAEVKEALNASGTAPIYACRAWVNFDGTGTVSIRASGNVSSITDNGTGDYTVNFATTMEDADYSVTGINETSGSSRGAHLEIKNGSSFLTSSFNVEVIDAGPGALTDVSIITVAIFR